MCNPWHLPITPKRAALQIWRRLASFYRDIPWPEGIWYPDSTTDSHHNDVIWSCITSTIGSLCSNNGTQLQQVSENGKLRYKEDYFNKISISLHALHVRTYVYIDQPDMANSTAERLAIDLYNKLMSTEICLFRVLQKFEKYSSHPWKWFIKCCLDLTGKIGTNTDHPPRHIGQYQNMATNTD